MKRIHVELPEKELEFVEKVIALDFYKSRSEILRIALKDWIQKESLFLSTFNSDMKKLSDVHKKYIEFNQDVKSDLLPAYIPNEN